MNYVSDWKVGTGKKGNERETPLYNIDILVTNECTVDGLGMVIEQ